MIDFKQFAVVLAIEAVELGYTNEQIKVLCKTQAFCDFLVMRQAGNLSKDRFWELTKKLKIINGLNGNGKA